MYFLIEETHPYGSYDLSEINIIDYSEDKNVLESKAKKYTESYESELDFIKTKVEPYIEKYKIQLEAEWKIYCIPYKYPNSPKHEDRDKVEIEFAKEFFKRNVDAKILKYLNIYDGVLKDHTRLMSRYYEIKELKKSVNEYTLS